MAWVKARDIAYGRLRSPDLDVAEEFLTRFGLHRVARTDTALYMRGTDPVHHLHVTEKGDSKFVGLAYYVDSEDDLKRLAKAPGATGVEHIDEPGGGKRVRLTEPNGYQIEVVCDLEKVDPIAVPRQKMNTGAAPTARAGELMRLPKGPAHVKRIGHGVMMTPKFRETVDWFREYLGFICSDDVYAGEENNLIGSFNRCDNGDNYVDHHVFFCLKHEKTGLNHMSFEVPDIDDVCMGHDYLKKFGYEHMWGIGRHVLGSQVYDYWADPWGRVHEHWADSDRLNIANGSNLVSVDEALVSQWGEKPPEKFINHASP
ncbi:MAG TPA: VOC family protein [Xanthobacteraceae bacterium]|jgi:catechol 2,3-dioxygenase-like lactoylglutathione lyase family enzyme|nr:VOC family protein [Xanthobacteraceae bacterium]